MADASVQGLGVVVREFGKLSVEQLTFAAPGPGQVRMRVSACGVCHSDVSALSGKILNPLPLVLGHEGAGFIDAVGTGVGGWKKGDRAILTLISPCNDCPSCLAGRPSLCAKRDASAPVGRVLDSAGTACTPFSALGCMAEYCVVSCNALIPCASDMPLEKGALVSCGVTTGVGAAVNRARVHPGSSVCVIGCGAVGLSVIQGARICGATQIVAVDAVPLKLEAAKRFGATDTVNVKEVENVVKAVKKLTGGGVDYGFEAIGLPQTLEQVIATVRPGGTAVMVGVGGPKDEIKVKMNIFLSEKIVTGTLLGSSVPSLFVPKLVDLYKKGDLLLDEMISRYYKIGEAQAAFDELHSGANLRGIIAMHELEKLIPGSKL